MNLKLPFLPLMLMAAALAVLAGPVSAAESPLSLGKLIGLPVTGDDQSSLGDVDDVLIGYDGRIIDFVIILTGEAREGQRVRVPWADVAIERDPLQVKFSNTEKSYTPYPGPPRGTLGAINGALITMVLGAPAKTRLGQRVGEVVSLGANADGRIVDVVLSQGGRAGSAAVEFRRDQTGKVDLPDRAEHRGSCRSQSPGLNGHEMIHRRQPPRRRKSASQIGTTMTAPMTI